MNSDDKNQNTPHQDTAFSHSSIVYFHGIGNPNLHVSMSSFLDALDQQGANESYEDLGKLRDFKYKIEIHGSSDKEFIQFRQIRKKKGKHISKKIIRAYEGYWGNDVDKPASLLQLLQWVFLTFYLSLSALLSRWRKYPTLKLRYLQSLEAKVATAADKEKLSKIYRNFENWENRKRYPKGSFENFKALLEESNTKTQFGDYTEASLKWKRGYTYNLLRRLMRQVAFLVVSLASLTLLIFILSFSTNHLVLYLFPDAGYEVSWIAKGLVIILFIKVTWLSVRRRFSDVITWTLDSESDERYEVRERRVKQAMNLIRDVVSDPRCNECFIVGHSLGSAIALEAVIREGRRCDAINICESEKKKMADDIEKIKFIFTAGSPVDHILSLFEKDRTFSHRFSRLSQQKSLSLSSRPFVTRNNQPGARVVNFWSKYDPISGKILSLPEPSNLKEKLLQNIEVTPQGAPNPLKAHSGFFFSPRAIRKIYRGIMTGRLN
ncbi:hypothetical protein ACFMBG_04335 [Leisingera sp. D0M16]|uniref:hypothetical protein n=1 Tax=Leisingera coralii TaxID=3351347 RepID=UPI003B80024B